MASRWTGKGGIREVLSVGLPLVASMASSTVMQFTDRVFLGHYSLETLAASISGSMSNFVFMCFFVGVASYANVFVAQYMGASQPRKVGAVVWQSIWFALLAWIFMCLLALGAPAIFALAGHSPEVQNLEVIYFRFLNIFSGANILAVGLSTFFSGRGRTRIVMLVSLFTACINIPLDYALIFGAGPFPRLGIAGAGLATGIGWVLSAVLYAVLIFRPRNDALYGVFRSCRLDGALFMRLMRFGIPSGVQFFLDMFGVAFFIMLVGRMGDEALAVTNMIFSLDNFSSLPLYGLHVASEILVGRALGSNNTEQAVFAAKNAVLTCLGWAVCIAAVFVLAPGPLLEMFRPAGYDAAAFAQMRHTGEILLLYVAAWAICEAVAVGFLGALKGAGDTRFVMFLMGWSSMLTLVIPPFLLIEFFDAGVFTVWLCVVLNVFVLMAAASLRFRRGKWKDLRVIAQASQ
ncbi:MATE family efflux transporter [Desulfobaculum bizertense]|uniref:MATE family efflux transporter n=1 Tax=Desulfobaculum bizertense TaxID=376490 RepID=UPI001F3D7A82|nr:MATE family efflux transporter [Desulfobaculum bizertense]UIJ37117.1 MATE family efflux transporter [Desulfobaculum bizertense]